MSNFTLAFVNFFKEKRGRKIVDISDIDLFNPSHHDDFDGDATYDVKWAHLPNEGSASTEGFFDAKIICLGENLDDLIQEADRFGVRIPQNEVTSRMEKSSRADSSMPKSSDTPPKSSKGRKLVKRDKQVLLPSESSSLPKKKKKKLDENISHQCKSLDNYDSNLFEPDISVTVKADPNPRMAKKRKSSLQETTGEKRKKHVLDTYDISTSTVDPKKSFSASSKTVSAHKSDEKRSKTQTGSVNASKVSQLNSPAVVRKDVSPGDPSKGNPTSGRSSFDFPDKGQQFVAEREHQTLSGLPDGLGESIIDAGGHGSESDSFSDKSSKMVVETSRGTALRNTRKSNNGQLCVSSLPSRESSASKIPLSSSNDSSSEMGSVSDVEKHLYFNKMIKLEAQLKREQSKIRHLEEQVESQAEAIKQHLKEIEELTNESRRFSKLNAELSEKLLKFLSSNANSESREHVNQNVMSSGLKSSPAASPAVKKRSNEKVPAMKVLFPEDSDATDSDDAEKNTASISRPKTPTVITKSAKKSAKSPKSPKSEDGVTSNDELYKMILLALQGKAPLQHDGNGKVHIGNGVWISEKTWDDKIRKANVSPSIAVRDIMSKIYTSAEMAERSLEGATPVKSNSSGQKIKKKKMTPQKTEAVLGVYRAKTVAASGSEDPCFLNLAVKKGKDTIKYKLKEAATALKSNA